MSPELETLQHLNKSVNWPSPPKREVDCHLKKYFHDRGGGGRGVTQAAGKTPPTPDQAGDSDRLGEGEKERPGTRDRGTEMGGRHSTAEHTKTQTHTHTERETRAETQKYSDQAL